jgi:hypothetical protein
VWITLFIVLSVFGLAFVGTASIGNEVNCKRWWKPLVGMLAVLGFTGIPFVSSIPTWKYITTDAIFIQSTSFFLGLLICSFHLSHTFAMVAPKWLFKRYPFFQRLLYPSTVRSEKYAKMALHRKLNTMVNNAITVVNCKREESVMESYFGQALHSFARAPRTFETIGGFHWTWTSIRDKSIYEHEGVWYSARLLASSIAQWVVCIYILWTGLSFARTTMDSYNPEDATAKMDKALNYALDTGIEEGLVRHLLVDVTSTFGKYLRRLDGLKNIGLNCSSYTTADAIIDQYCQTTDGILQCDPLHSTEYLCAWGDLSSKLDSTNQLALLNASGIDVDSLLSASRLSIHKASEQTVNSLYPSAQYMIFIPLYVGVVAAFFTALNLALTYIPSVTTTILKLRCGALPTLHNPDFDMYRIAPETVALLTGSLFWGCLVSSLVTGGMFGLVVFFFLWQATAYFAQRFVALFVGVLVITLIRIALICFCRKSYYRAFYRKSPAAANISILALEWANFALSAGFIFVRMIKLLIVAGFAVGRIDRPFLAEGVGRVNGVEVDNFPSIHLRDVLAHEAHRHPYIELLGTMYLMKLRYSTHFCENAGSCWRLLFVYALMPWLHKYRIVTRTSAGKLTKSDLEKQYSEEIGTYSSASIKAADDRAIGRRDQPIPQDSSVARAQFLREESERLMEEDEVFDDTEECSYNAVASTRSV